MQSLHKISELGYFMILLKQKKQGQDKEKNTRIENTRKRIQGKKKKEKKFKTNSAEIS